MPLYFAYGSNMDQTRMKERKCDFEEAKLQRGVLKGYKLSFNKINCRCPGAGFANIMPASEDDFVEGVIYEISENSLNSLDCCEGVPKHYKRKNMSVQTDEGIVKCEVYVASPSRIKDGLKPTREYLDHLLKGKPFLSKQYFRQLEQTATLD